MNARGFSQEVEPLVVRPRRLAQTPANRFLVRDTLNPAALLERGGLNSHLARWTDRAAAMSPAPLRSRVDRRLRESIASAVRGRYAESDARTVELTALDLRRCGYDLLGDPS